MIVSDEKIIQFVRETLEDAYLPTLSLKDTDLFVDMYNRVKYEPSQQYKNEEDIKTMIGNLMQAEDNSRRGEEDSSEIELNRYSSNKHMYIFDEVLHSGESKRIVEALNRYGLTSEALKGFKFYTRKQDFDENGNIQTQGLGNGITVIVEYDEDVSFSIKYFEITYKGHIIYEWDDEKGYVWEHELDVPEETHYELAGYKETVDKRGVTRLRDKHGRFVRRV